MIVCEVSECTHEELQSNAEILFAVKPVSPPCCRSMKPSITPLSPDTRRNADLLSQFILPRIPLSNRTSISQVALRLLRNWGKVANKILLPLIMCLNSNVNPMWITVVIICTILFIAKKKKTQNFFPHILYSFIHFYPPHNQRPPLWKALTDLL